MSINLNYTGPSGQIYFVAVVQRMSDLTFSSGDSGPFLAGLTFNQKQILLNEVAGMLGEYRVTLDNSSWIDSEYIYSVCDSGKQLVLGAQNFWTKSGIECGPSGLPYQVWDEPIALHNINGTYGSGENKNFQDLYFANVKTVVSDGTQQDYIGVSWYKNNFIVSSGALTNPAVSVYRTDTGAVLLNNGVMSYSSAQLASVYTNIGTPNLFPSGIPILVNVSGTIDGITRNWNSIVGVDIL